MLFVQLIELEIILFERNKIQLTFVIFDIFYFLLLLKHNNMLLMLITKKKDHLFIF